MVAILHRVLRTIARNVSLSNRKMGECGQVLSCHSWHYYPETSLQSSVSPNTNQRHGCNPRSTLHSPKAPRKMYLSTSVFSFAGLSSVHSRSVRSEFTLTIGLSHFGLASFDFDHLLSVQGFEICIIWSAASCWDSLSSVWIACIKLFTVEYNTSAPCFSITVSFSGFSGAPENRHIIW